MKIKHLLFASSALAMAAPGHAETPATPAPAPGTTTAPDTDQLPDIIVTAEHRAVNIQKVPLAITAIDGDMLARQNIDSASQLQNVVPGLKILEIGVQPSVFIRGIGGAVANVLNDPAASYNVDGVAVARPVSINGLFFDLERAEVLKGPQGTLYGGNATVGAINIISHRPEFAFGASAGLTIGNYGTIKSQGMLNVPVSDTLAVRASFQTNNHKGYLTSGADDADDYGVRLKLLFKPSSNFEALLNGTYFHSGGAGTGDVPLKSATGSFLVPSNPWYVGAGPDVDNGGLVVPRDAHQSLTSKTVSGQFKLTTSIGTFTIIPSYIKTNYNALTYNGGFSQQYQSSDREASVEARLASNDDAGSPFKWALGGIYQNVHQISTVVQHINGLPPGPPLYQSLPIDLTTRSYGLFGQATYSIVSSLRVTGGIRYTNDHKVLVGLNNTILGSPNGPVIGSFPDSGNATFSNIDYRAGFDYDLGPTSLFYGNFSTGYKAGGINPGLAPNTYKPEHLTAFQLGLKNSFFDRKLQINVETWYWKYRDFNVQQFILLNTPTGVSPGFGTTTANRAKNYGVELMANLQVTRHDRLNVNAQYDVAKYVDFLQTSVFPVPSKTNYAGQTVMFAPEFSANINYEHTFDLGDLGELVGSVNHQFLGPTLITLQAFPGQHVGSTNVTDLQATLRLRGGKLEIGGYVDNLENEPVILFAGATPAGVWGHPRPPRTFGGRVNVKY